MSPTAPHLFDFSAPDQFIKRHDKAGTPLQNYRTDFMRDRDRVMYSTAFRRLAGKTQIYLAGGNDHQRNRLTHTLEVSQIARTLSQALGLDCDLTEAIALGHDLGHAPFGHAGEQILHEIMVPASEITIKGSPLAKGSDLISYPSLRSAPLYGFKHNVQSVRIAASLENNYGSHGLNLTNYTLWGILHHSSLTYKADRVKTRELIPEYQYQYKEYCELKGHPDKEAWSFEALVVALADEIAQWHHDLEDALHGNTLGAHDVWNAVSKTLGAIMCPDDQEMFALLEGRETADEKYHKSMAHIVVNTLVSRVIACSAYNLERLWTDNGLTSETKDAFFLQHGWDEASIKEAVGFRRIGETNDEVGALEEYTSIIREKVHHSRTVERMNAKGQYIIKKLFQAYFSHPQQLPNSVIIAYMMDIEYPYIDKIIEAGVGAVRTEFENLHSNKTDFDLKKQIVLMRRICDHIAAMTDHYAIEEYKDLYG